MPGAGGGAVLASGSFLESAAVPVTGRGDAQSGEVADLLPGVALLAQGQELVVGDVIAAGPSLCALDPVDVSSDGGLGYPDEASDVRQGPAAPVESSDTSAGGLWSVALPEPVWVDLPVRPRQLASPYQPRPDHRLRNAALGCDATRALAIEPLPHDFLGGKVKLKVTGHSPAPGSLRFEWV